ncbi:ATP synthase subunit I [Pseudoalteromonas tunicata]|uniref:ATP synthase subunit I n=1 Tax=Pseudoalteromonas tunicata TaxID=314281 RepID=UPI00274026D5|nr:ATP synthase subunit I [Pseudoalteromonas tunicata]MDP5212362.1 ATP synthase subunit I [Pseudoalteromonas tunicata]
MQNRLANHFRLAAFKLIALQSVIAVVCAVFVFVGWGVNAGLSAFAGGLVSVLPNFVFAAYAFRFVGASKAKQVFASFKRGNGLKFLLTIFLFALIFKLYPVMFLPFFSSFVLVMFAGLFAPVFFNH